MGTWWGRLSNRIEYIFRSHFGLGTFLTSRIWVSETDFSMNLATLKKQTFGGPVNLQILKDQPF